MTWKKSCGANRHPHNNNIYASKTLMFGFRSKYISRNLCTCNQTHMLWCTESVSLTSLHSRLRTRHLPRNYRTTKIFSRVLFLCLPFEFLGEFEDGFCRERVQVFRRRLSLGHRRAISRKNFQWIRRSSRFQGPFKTTPDRNNLTRLCFFFRFNFFFHSVFSFVNSLHQSVRFVIFLLDSCVYV